MVAHGFVTAQGNPAEAVELLLRVHSLLGVHAEGAGGCLCPTGVDIGLAVLPTISAAIDVGFALQAEVEGVRPAGHHHSKLLSLGISWGGLVEMPDSRMLGTPVARALRLATLGGPAGEVLLDERASIDDLPEGLGRFEGKRGLRDLLGFGFHHLVDYR